MKDRGSNLERYVRLDTARVVEDSEDSEEAGVNPSRESESGSQTTQSKITKITVLVINQTGRLTP